VLLKEFFEAFFLCFFPAWAARFEFIDIDWLDKEIFLAPPQGEKRQLDLVARLRLRPGAPPPRTGVTDLVALVHVELESRASTLAFRPRMFEYYVQLRRDTGLPVLPIALFLRVGLDGIGWDAYEEHFWEQRIVRFEYAYVGLPALDGEQYATGENLLGVALSALMRLPVDRRAELYAEGLKRIAGSGENDYRRFLRNFSKMPSARQLVRWFGDQAALQTGSGNLCSGSARSRRQSLSSPLRRAASSAAKASTPCGDQLIPRFLQRAETAQSLYFSTRVLAIHNPARCRCW